MARCWAIAALWLIAATALAGADGWVTHDGEALPDTAYRKSADGFGGWLVVTPDPDWKDEWDAPPRDVPGLETARYVDYGDRLTILACYTNPATDADGRIHVRCDVRVTRPDGTVASRAADRRCASPAGEGDLQALRLSWLVVEYVGERSDATGQWLVEVTIIDAVRGVSIPLRADFVLVGGSV